MILRAARSDDVPAIGALIEDAGIALSRGFYTDVQARAITSEVYGVDTQLVVDGTYFVIEDAGRLVAAGGWSKRGTLFGSDHAKRAHGGGATADPLLDPAHEAARIRAFFVAPSGARRGLGTRLLRHCAAEAWAAGFRRLTLVSTMPGEPLYRRFGFVVDERFDLPLSDGVTVPLASMSRSIDGPTLASTD